MESAIAHASEIQRSQQQANLPAAENVNKLAARDDQRKTAGDCYRCGGNHNAAMSKFKDKECFYCKTKGHVAKKCRKKKWDNKGAIGKGDVHHLQNEAEGLSVEDDGGAEGDYPFFPLYKVGLLKEAPMLVDKVDLLEEAPMLVGKVDLLKQAPMLVDVEINRNPVKMELDTGASVSVMSRDVLYSLIGHEPELQPIKEQLRTFTGELIKPLGVAEVVVTYGDQEKTLPLVVTPNFGPTLLGRNWLRELVLDWNSLFCHHVDSKPVEDADLDLLLKEYEEVFVPELGTLKDVEVHIPVRPNAKPKFFKARSVPYAVKDKVEKELDRLVENGVYQPVKYSKWAAPIVPVKKPDSDDIRICGDYKITVNQAADIDNYPVPKTEDLLSTLNGCKLFCKLDFRTAYQQLLLDEESREIMTVNTHKGLFQPTRLQYGVHSASGIFQREMEKRFGHIPKLLVRVDDILIGGTSKSDVLTNLRLALQVVKESGLRLKREKCKFLATEIVYLGFLINAEGISPVKSKLEPIMKLPRPQNVTQLKSFLGMINYYHRHLPNLADNLEPLHRLLRKGYTWKWGDAQEASFKKAKDLLCSSGLLMHFDLSKEICVSCDASPYGLGAVLSHQLEGGIEKPIAYASRTLAPAERNYCQLEKEGLALVYAVKKFHQYLYGYKFTAITDHKPLLGLLAADKAIPSMASGRVQRWALLLAGYNYDLKYRPGSAIANSDCMSRLPLQSQETLRSTSDVYVADLVHAPVTSDEVRLHTRRDATLGKVLDFVLHGWPDSEMSAEELGPYKSRQNELSVEDGCVLWGNRVVIPPSLQSQVLSELHEAHPGMTRMKALARSYVWWPKMDKSIEEMVHGCNECQENQSMPAKAPIHPWKSSNNHGPVCIWILLGRIWARCS